MNSVQNSRNKFVTGFVLLLILLLFILIKLQTMPVPEISIDPPSLVIEKGDEFSFNITIDPVGASISAAQINLLFDSSLMKIKEVKEGDIFKQSGAKTIFNSGTPDNKKGDLINVWGLIITPGSIVTKKGTLAKVTMLADSPGTSFLNLTDVIISDPEGNSNRMKVTNSSILIKEH